MFITNCKLMMLVFKSNSESFLSLIIRLKKIKSQEDRYDGTLCMLSIGCLTYGRRMPYGD